MSWDGDEYQRRFDDLAAAGTDVHGEATLVRSFGPGSVLDAGCGTGRVAIELARHGIDVEGVDVDPSMVATARRLAPRLTWHLADLDGLDLGRTFDLVVMAGNVLLFTPPGSEAAVVAACARHLAPAGLLVAGFQLDGRCPIDAYDRHCREAGLELVERWATWDRGAFGPDAGYAVSVHHLAT